MPGLPLATLLSTSNLVLAPPTTCRFAAGLVVPIPTPLLLSVIVEAPMLQAAVNIGTMPAWAFPLLVMLVQAVLESKASCATAGRAVRPVPQSNTIDTANT